MAKEFKLKDVTSLNLKNGEKKEVEVEGVEGGKVLLLKVQDKVHATSANCTHFGAPLAKGVLTPEGRLTCPWHGGMTAFYMRKVLTDRSQLASLSQRAMSKMLQLLTLFPSTRCSNATAPYTSRQTKTRSRPTGDT
jgi:nitrite reductase/ring-hydroxylating ferredoxin subunit